jgi:hypothetical protein
MINSFSQFLVEEERVVYFTFGRMNPPTIGHGKLLDKLASAAGRNPYRIFLSQSNEPKENPLPYSNKIKHVRKMFPKHARSVMVNKKVVTPFHALSALYEEGFRKVVMVAGSDRVNEYDLRLNKYNGKKGGHGFYNFEGGIKLVSAGQRDPDAKGAAGASGTKQRGFAKDNNFTSFAQNLPKAMSNQDAKRLFNDVRKGMGLKEAKEFKNHVQLEPVSELREAYIRDDLFELGEEVVITNKGIVGKIQHLGSNYLIVESKGEKWRCWLDQVSKVDPENIKLDYEVEDLPKGYSDGILREDNTKSMYMNKPDWGTPESTKKWKEATPGQNEEFNIDDITADFSVEKQGIHTVSLQDLNEAYIPEKDERKKDSPQDPDIKGRPGTQPKAYHKGLSKAQKISRDRQFKRQSKMDDDNPAAYKPAAGDKTTKTKPSKHTKKFKQMFGENDQVDIAKKRIEREKQMDKRKHDRMMDRARMRDVKKKNKET